MIVLQLEVGGSVTTRQLDNLISQTEYSLAVTPIYDEGPGQTMVGSAVTGKNGKPHNYKDIVVMALAPAGLLITLNLTPSSLQMWFLPQRTSDSQRLPRPASEPPGSTEHLMWLCTG